MPPDARYDAASDPGEQAKADIHPFRPANSLSRSTIKIWIGSVDP
jgi:hypothetical protein